ncbi:unnamed protein product [Ixodes hexagonus]
MAEGTVKVAVRVRPALPKEEQNSHFNGVIKVIPEAGQVVVVDEHGFAFDYAFDTTTTQEEIYDKCVADVISKVTTGYNCSVLMYGQTGSGKTYTMGTNYGASGRDGANLGIIPRALEDLFESILRTEAGEWSIEVSFLEIYNENVYDLLTDPKGREPIQIREHGKVVMLPGLVQRQVMTPSEALLCLEQGCYARSTGATLVNSSSSRSHAIFTVHLQCLRKGTLFTSKLQLVDLAGSETIKNTHSVGARRKEGVNINLGLLALGNVINALCSHPGKALHIPYRDSCLTRLLAESLNGSSHTVMIACISPTASDWMETLKTLRYAERAQQIKTKPVINRSNKENFWYRGTPAPTPARKRYTCHPSLKTPRDAPVGHQGPHKMASTPVDGMPDEKSASFRSTSSRSSLFSNASNLSPVMQQAFPLTPLVERVCERLEKSTFTAGLLKRLDSFLVPAEKENYREGERCLSPLQLGDANNRTTKRKATEDNHDVSKELEPDHKVPRAAAADTVIRRRRTTMTRLNRASRSPDDSIKENNQSKSDESDTTMIEMAPSVTEGGPPQPKPPPDAPPSVIANRTRRRTTMFGRSEKVQEPAETQRTRTSICSGPDCNDNDVTLTESAPAQNEGGLPQLRPAASVPQSAVACRTRRRTTVFAQPAPPGELRDRRSMFCGPKRDKPRKAASLQLTARKPEEMQRKHRSDSLKLLQTGSEKRLQTFACVGPKTAKARISLKCDLGKHILALHRELKGNFKDFADLKDVEGLSQNFFKKFMSSNILTV